MTFWIVFLSILSLHLVYKWFWNYSRVKQLDGYIKLRKDDNERFAEEAAVIKELLTQAGLEDVTLTINDSRGISYTGFGIDQFIPNRIQVSLFQNLASADRQITPQIDLYLKQAKGVFRSRSKEALRVTYFIDLIISLPKNILQYYGVSAKSVSVNIFEVIYRVLIILKVLIDLGLVDLKSII